MRVNKQELKERLSKKRAVYTPLLINNLWEDLESLGWILFDESALKRKLDGLETSIRYDPRVDASVELIKRLRKEIWGGEGE